MINWIEILYFIGPVFIAGIIHHLIVIKYNLLPFLAIPIDNNIQYRQKPLLGNTKTWRGIILVPLLTGVCCLVISNYIEIQTVFNPFIMGAVIGLGYALAELPNSFIKRRVGIQPGGQSKSKYKIIFYIIDQIDSVLGAVMAMILIHRTSYIIYISIFVIGIALHCCVDVYLNLYGYKKLRQNI
jgi:hypothetical protein